MIDAPLKAVETDDVVRFRGIVQEIRARTIEAVAPGVAVATQCRGVR